MIEDGVTLLEEIERKGITKDMIRKLKAEGIYTVESLASRPMKELILIKGFSEKKCQ